MIKIIRTARTVRISRAQIRIVQTQNKKKSYLVRVSIDNLNIRQSPTIHSAAVGFTGKGTFTITEEATGIVNAAGDKSR